ncbi:hypothetical protein [Rhizobium rhizogenes]|uniref:hypothetical protein n=1 Tax=Rhizobium rhizogenes TaxID=359 RepID=UPI001571FD40|nr:hypothetical protein [Rhizobium rhizogenes]NTF67717.1 hypothetical protein [Rhizobium rhizogenes]
MKKPASAPELQRLIDLIEIRVSILPAYSYDERATYNAAVNKIIDQLSEAEGAKFTDGMSWGGYALKLAGIRATCTGSATGALTNWIAAVRRAIVKLQDGAP